MIQLQAKPLSTVADAIDRLQMAVELEFSTLPPYLYAKFSILPDTNAAAAQYLGDIVMQEMIHMCLACNIMSALGGTPQLVQPEASPPFPPVFPGPLPGDIGPPGGAPLTISLLPFSPDATAQGMAIEQPENPLIFPVVMAALADSQTETIGQFYAKLDAFLATLPDNAWQAQSVQIVDEQFFPGQLFAVTNYADAHRAITQIVSEGEGTEEGTDASPLDFQNQPAHYYRFEEMNRNLVLTRSGSSFQWGPDSFGVDYTQVYAAIPNPGQHDFSGEPQAAQDAQKACNLAFTALVDALQATFKGGVGQMGIAVRAMFDLRKAALIALQTPLNSGSVAGPAFLYIG
ncbi:ferritin-like domain-containing protein [Sphingomonas sp.]|uniref:ferritin-like domain-containing protein n=1 Tax=Sphingomonas sp. TaxID=28214 RepID=UPI003B3B07AD